MKIIFMVLGRMPLDELKDILDIDLNIEETDYDTVAGLVLNFAGQIPREGYSFKFENHRFTVKEVLNKRIKKIQVEKIEKV